jgi:hypothetical protein
VLSIPAPTWIDVSDIEYRRHEKSDKPPSLMVDREWACLAQRGYPLSRAQSWWPKRQPGQAVPSTVDEALRRTYGLSTPRQIVVVPDGRLTRVVGWHF